jgi:ABC-type nitrate/sulfonate/bicarbonate transport system substrate-binding protein
MSGEIKVFIPPMSVGVEAPEGIHGLVLGMPSTYTDLLLKDWLRKKGIDVSNKNLGVVLIGFNIHKL